MSRKIQITSAVGTLAVAAGLFLFGLAVYWNEPSGGPRPFYVCAILSVILVSGILFPRWWPLLLIFSIAMITLLADNGDWDRLASLITGMISCTGICLAFGLASFYWQRWKFGALNEAFRKFYAGDVPGSVGQIREYIHKNGPSALAYTNLAAFLGCQQKWEEALRVAEEAQGLGFQDPVLIMNKGVALLELGQREESLDCFEKVIQSHPDHFYATCNCAFGLAALGGLEEAATVLKRAKLLFKKQRRYCDAREKQIREQTLDRLRQKISGEGSLAEPASGPPAQEGSYETNICAYGIVRGWGSRSGSLNIQSIPTSRGETGSSSGE